MIIFLKKIYRSITGYFKTKKFEKINTILQDKVDEIEVDKIILKGRIVKMVERYLNVDADSKYIPKTRRNHTEIRERIIAEFGQEMSKTGVRINDKLELV